MEREAGAEAFREAMRNPARILHVMARAGDRDPLADYLENSVKDLNLLNERRSLSGAKLREHIDAHPGLETRVERFLQSLADPELTLDLSRLVRYAKVGAVGWTSSKRVDRQKLDAWAEVWARIDASDGHITAEEAIRAVAADEQVCRRLKLDPDNAYERIRRWYYEAEREARELRDEADPQDASKESE